MAASRGRCSARSRNNETLVNHRRVVLPRLGAVTANGGIDDAQIFSCSQGKFEGIGDVPDDLGGLPYATEVVDVVFGDNAGFGQEEFPEIVFGPPDGRGNSSGSLDVLSLGAGGEIVLGFGDRAIVDGPGPDFIVFENSFWPNGVCRVPYLLSLRKCR